MMELIKTYLLTIIIEIIVLIIHKKLFKNNKLFLITLFFSLLYNLITNIPLNLIENKLVLSSFFIYWLLIILLEIVVVLIEAIVIYIINKDLKISFILSFATNMISFVVGSFILYLINIIFGELFVCIMF